MSAKDNSNSASIPQTAVYKSRRMFNVVAILLLLSFLLFLCQMINLGVFKAAASGSDSLPVSIRAESQADYTRDIHALSIPPISENILRQIIVDMPATGSPQDRMATLQVVLSSPIPTMTPDYPFTATISPTRTIQPTSFQTPTTIPTLLKTRTPTSIFTATKFFTPAKTFTPTRTSTLTKTATSTLVPTPTRTLSPTVTLTATVTPTSAPTATVEVLTHTPTPTPTPTVESPTDTPTSTFTPTEAIPTDTPTPTATPSCALTSGGISISGQEIDMTIANNGSTLVTITSINVNWPDTPTSQTVKEVKFNGVTIVISADPQPPSDYPSENNWTGAQSDRELAASDSKLLEFLFQDNLQSSGYSITVTFDNGCILNESN